MATTITIDEQALSDADTFLTALLSEKIPDADFSRGGVLRDFVITAVAYIYAYLEKERKKTRDQQSLLALSTQPDDEATSDAANAIISNWFLNRRTGRTARVTTTLHFSAAADVSIALSTRFFRTSDAVFVPDTTTAYVIPAGSLMPVYNANNVVTEYVTTINLVARDVGTAYNLPAGRFVQADQFSPFFTYAENQSAITGGTDIENTADLLVRAPTGITVRNLVNARSIDTVLKETFSNITRVLPLGFGAPEMLRDFSSEAVTRLRMHVGGFTDIATQLPITEVVETGTIGGSYTRPDNIIAVFKDTTANFLGGTPVLPGDILRVVSYLPDAPREYIIATVSATALTVSSRAAFSEATDEVLPAGAFCSYTIGDTAPNFSDKRSVTATALTGGQTSRTMQVPACVVLQGRPHYRIKRVELFEVGTPATIEYVTTRVNGTPARGEYRVISYTPANAQSAYAVDLVEVNLTGYTDGVSQARITYDTLVGYDDVQALVVNQFERVLASNPLARGYTPVYLSLSIAYRLCIGATTTVDTTAAAIAVATFINTFDLVQTLDLTAILKYLRDTYPQIGAIISPTNLTYNLFAPDGQVYSYSTLDVVTIFPNYPVNNAHLTNGTALRTIINYADVDPSVPANTPLFATANTALRNQLAALGVSDRTLIYLTSASDISLTLVS